jgi:hypothetical protein
VSNNIQYFGDNNKKPLVVVIENFYSEEELKLIWRELKFLTNQNKLLPGAITGSAKDEFGNKKTNWGLFLDAVYANRNISDILTLNRKLFNEDFVSNLIKLNPIFRILETCNNDTTLLSYYQNGDNYFSHTDLSALTSLYYFFKEPKKFVGGDLIFNDFNLKITPKNNMLIIFPGCYRHEVTKVEMDNNDFDSSGRYCLSQFLNYGP